MSRIQKKKTRKQAAADTPPAVPMLEPEQVVDQLRTMRSQIAEVSPLAMCPGCCSHSHQSQLRLSPSTWWAALEVPQRKPRGKRRWPSPLGVRGWG